MSDVVADLEQRLNAAADPATKAWFENYLKQAIAYRGVRTPEVTRIVADWRQTHGLERLEDGEQLDLARTLVEGSFAEDKFAGILYMQKHLVRRHTRYLPEHAAYKARKRGKGGKHNHPPSRGV